VVAVLPAKKPPGRLTILQSNRVALTSRPVFHSRPDPEPAMTANRRSRNITEGVARAPNRSMYYAMGYR
jgi:hypothetical protein